MGWSFNLSRYISFGNKLWEPCVGWPTDPLGQILNLKQAAVVVLHRYAPGPNASYLSREYWLHYSLSATSVSATHTQWGQLSKAILGRMSGHKEVIPVQAYISLSVSLFVSYNLFLSFCVLPLALQLYSFLINSSQQRSQLSSTGGRQETTRASALCYGACCGSIPVKMTLRKITDRKSVHVIEINSKKWLNK